MRCHSATAWCRVWCWCLIGIGIGIGIGICIWHWTEPHHDVSNPCKHSNVKSNRILTGGLNWVKEKTSEKVFETQVRAGQQVSFIRIGFREWWVSQATANSIFHSQRNSAWNCSSEVGSSGTQLTGIVSLATTCRSAEFIRWSLVTCWLHSLAVGTMSQVRLAMFVTGGVLGGGLLGFYIQHAMIEKYGIKKPEVDPAFRQLVPGGQPRMASERKPLDVVQVSADVHNNEFEGTEGWHDPARGQSKTAASQDFR